MAQTLGMIQVLFKGEPQVIIAAFLLAIGYALSIFTLHDVNAVTETIGTSCFQFVE